MSKTETQDLKHVAIIMDGNGRWAQKRGLPRSMGHQKGAERVQEVLETLSDEGVSYVTLYAFSTENWNRSDEEVSSLMNLLRRYLQDDVKKLQEKGVKVKFIGEREMLPEDIQLKMKSVEEATEKNTTLTVCIALSYGGQQEIVKAAQKLALLVKKGDIEAQDIDTKIFAGALYTRDIPCPDLMIRTGGEQRISNYLLWQLAYAEFYFSDILWPDFGKDDVKKIIQDFKKRERRYGKA